jgi:hypothetical protein
VEGNHRCEQHSASAVSLRTSERRMKDSPSATPRASFCSTGCSRVRRGHTGAPGGMVGREKCLAHGMGWVTHLRSRLEEPLTSSTEHESVAQRRECAVVGVQRSVGEARQHSEQDGDEKCEPHDGRPHTRRWLSLTHALQPVVRHVQSTWRSALTTPRWPDDQQAFARALSHLRWRIKRRSCAVALCVACSAGAASGSATT